MFSLEFLNVLLWVSLIFLMKSSMSRDAQELHSLLKVINRIGAFAVSVPALKIKKKRDIKKISKSTVNSDVDCQF